MPEGPECTIVADQLDTAARGWSLTNVELLTGRYTKKEPVGFSEFMDDLGKDGKYIHSVSNKGKFIYWLLEGGVIFSTLGMSGTYKTENNKYARVRFDIKDNVPGRINPTKSLYYSDMRNFGTLKFISKNPQQELDKKLATIGPDMLNDPCRLQTWLDICEKRKNNSLVKFLMEQKNISGVGNIYKSESLFLAELAPHRKVGDCTEEEKIRLYEAVIAILRTAYEAGGATIRNYSDLHNNYGKYISFPSKATEMMKERIGVMVYSQTRDPHGNPIEKCTLDDGRTTHWSPNVQK